MNPLPSVVILLEMTGAGQTAVDLRDHEVPEKRVVCTAQGKLL